jgi:hypothetical protein
MRWRGLRVLSAEMDHLCLHCIHSISASGHLVPINRMWKWVANSAPPASCSGKASIFHKAAQLIVIL